MAKTIKTTSAVLGAIGLAAFLGVSQPATAGEVGLYRGAGGHFNVRATSLKEARFRTVVKQMYDFSCGSAALATLLSYHYDQETSETEVFRAMFEGGDRERIARLGFSLLDMKTYLAGRGLRADGYRVGLDTLARVGVPAITLIETNGYKHFVVIKGVRGDDVLVGDPAAGLRIYSRERFDEIWGGIVFLIRDEASTGRASFNRDQEWRFRPRAPLGTALAESSLASFTTLMPQRHF
jgi:predicted double-glycine peptidase